MKYLKKIAKVFGLILLVLVLLELFLRFLGFVHLLKIESINLSGRSDRSDQTVLCIGDSWTVGARDGNYPNMLKEQLDAAGGMGRVKVLNLGMSGSNSSMAVDVLKKNLARHHPGLVIVLTGNNDHWNLNGSSYWEFEEKKKTGFTLFRVKLRIFILSLRVHKLFRLIVNRIKGIPADNTFLYAGRTAGNHYKTFYINRDVHRKQLEYNLIRLIELSRERGFNLIFMTYFHFHGFKVNEVIRDTALTYRVPFIDNNFLFHREIDPNRYRDYLIPDGHPNAKGYRFIADKLAELIVSRKLLGSR